MQFFSKTFSAETSSCYSLNTACFDVEVNPIDKLTYKSVVEVAELGSLTLALVQNHSAIVVRKNEEHTCPETKRFTLMYAIEGEMMISHNHGTTSLKTGQLILVDNSYARKMFVYKSVKLLLICVSGKVLERYIPLFEALLSQVIHEPTNSQGLSLFSPVLALWDHLKAGELEEFSSCIGEELLKDVSNAYAQHYTFNQRSRHTLQLINRVKHYIEANLSNSSLSAEAIAAEFKISSRYLRSLFQGGKKLTQYIQRRRLEESARLLSSPQHQTSTITDITYLCGFNSSTHFARCFRSQYKETARDFRRRHLQMEQESIKLLETNIDQAI